MYKLLILGILSLVLDSCCTKTQLSPNEKDWVTTYRAGQVLIFKSNRGNLDSIQVVKNEEFYTNSNCNWFEVGTTQAHTCQAKLKPKVCHDKYYCLISIEVSKESQNKYSPPFFRVFGLEHPSEFIEKGKDSYLNNLTKSVTLSTTGRIYKSAYIFKLGINADSYGDDYVQAFYWDKADGLIRYEGADGEIFELLTR